MVWSDSGQWSAHLCTHSGQTGKQQGHSHHQMHTHTHTHTFPLCSPVCSEDVCSAINLNTAPRFPPYLFEQLREELTLALCTIAGDGFGNRPFLLLRPFCWRGGFKHWPPKKPLFQTALAPWRSIKKKKNTKKSLLFLNVRGGVAYYIWARLTSNYALSTDGKGVQTRSHPAGICNWVTVLCGCWRGWGFGKQLAGGGRSSWCQSD